MSELPYDITEKILLRLPARSLIPLNLVCKQWRSLISNPKFVRDHTNRVLLGQFSGPPEMINHRIISNDDSSRKSIILESLDFKTFASTKLELKFQTPIVPVIAVIVGSCNGLWLISQTWNCDTLVLWNPLLSKKCKYLPKPNYAASYISHFDGLGYTPSTDDFKFVRLCGKIARVHNSRCYTELQAEVYSLKTNSWKLIPGLPARTDLVEYGNGNITSKAGTHIQGYIYWTIKDLQNAAIIAFDLITEKFKLLDTPSWDDGNVRCRQAVRVVHIQGCLGVYRHTHIDKDIVIWIWNEDENKKEYWTKFLTIPSKFHAIPTILSFLSNDEVLLHLSEHRGTQKLAIYDVKCMRFRDLPCGNVNLPVHMVETLISPLSY